MLLDVDDSDLVLLPGLLVSAFAWLLDETSVVSKRVCSSNLIHSHPLEPHVGKFCAWHQLSLTSGKSELQAQHPMCQIMCQCRTQLQVLLI